MKYTNNIYLLICFTITLVLAGCSSVPISFPTTLAKDVDVTQGRVVEGKSCGVHILYLIPININGRYEDAYKDLMERAGNDKIANLSIEESWSYIYVGNIYCTKLKATAYPLLSAIKERAARQSPVIKSVEERLAALKGLREKNLITEEEEKVKRLEILNDVQ
jgi:hypothetical protein